ALRPARTRARTPAPPPSADWRCVRRASGDGSPGRPDTARTRPPTQAPPPRPPPPPGARSPPALEAAARSKSRRSQAASIPKSTSPWAVLPSRRECVCHGARVAPRGLRSHPPTRQRDSLVAAQVGHGTLDVVGTCPLACPCYREAAHGYREDHAA